MTTQLNSSIWSNELEDISDIEMKTALDSTSKWKALGPDGIPKFWLKIICNLMKTFHEM